MVRPERPGDEAAIRAVQVAAFGQERHGRIVDVIRASDRFVPELSLVAVEDDRIVGHALVCEFDLAGDGRLLQLGPLGVLPERQRRGVGSALIAAAIAGARERGAPLLLLEGDPRYYGRFGFVAAAGYGLVPPEGVPPQAFQVLPLADELPSGRVEYPRVFLDEPGADM